MRRYRGLRVGYRYNSNGQLQLCQMYLVGQVDDGSEDAGVESLPVQQSAIPAPGDFLVDRPPIQPVADQHLGEDRKAVDLEEPQVTLKVREWSVVYLEDGEEVQDVEGESEQTFTVEKGILIRHVCEEGYQHLCLDAEQSICEARCLGQEDGEEG